MHKELSALSKKSGETYQEYIYRVLELASHTEMELEAKIQYVIDGIKDEEANKAILYSAATIKELQQRFMQYETQRNNRSKARQILQTHHKKKTTGSASQSATIVPSRRCFNCGDMKHVSKDCSNRSKGTKCYSCGEFGHIAAKCPKGANPAKKDPSPVRMDAIRACGDKKIYKEANILGRGVTAVIDPGSDHASHLIQSLRTNRCPTD